MQRDRAFVAATGLLCGIALVHAAVTWPVAAILALFGGGALIAFVAEAFGIKLGLLEHHIGPTLLGVPLYVLCGWTGTIYVSVRAALLVTEGWAAVAAAAVLATTFDILTDHVGVEAGHWTYTDDLPGPRFRGVPWWNFLAWVLISSLTAALAILFI